MKGSHLCACKGIRSCLLCEDKILSPKKQTTTSNQASLVYDYCHESNKCWCTDSSEPTGVLLDGILLIPDFISAEEQDEMVSGIDRIPWTPSQSGRMKQDFGPKVNFKKRKLKTGGFRGFPRFAFKIVERMSHLKILRHFDPVELCHLEYTPERGSAIEPHLDDSWLWGEHLVTLNLLSETVLTLSATDSQEYTNCGCGEAFRRHQDAPLDSAKSREGSIENSHCRRSTDADSLKTCHDVGSSKSCPDVDSLKACLNGKDESREEKIQVRVNLPPRSLLVIHGCARHHWFHEIKREHVTTRRLAMTFRELSEEFRHHDSQQYEAGKELLKLARNAIDL